MINIVLIIVLLIVSALTSASETSFSTVNRIRLKALADGGANKAKQAKTALKVAEHYDKTITAILITNTIVNIASTAVSTVLFTHFFGKAGAVLSTIVMTVLVLTFGEILPKAIAKENSESFALAFAGVVSVIIIVLTPLIKVFLSLKRFVTKFFTGEVRPTFTEDELKYMLEEIEGQGVLEEAESELVRSALEFDEIKLDEILIPRVKITAVEINANIDDVRELFFSEMYSRLPVYEKSIDNIVGYVGVKQFLKYCCNGGKSLRGAVRNILRFSELTLISDALKQMQTQNVHIAVVIDQYGGTKGIITMEDIIEELIGDVYDESDEKELDFIKFSDNSYEVSGSFSITEFAERLGLPPNAINTEANTIAGWIMEITGHIPIENEIVEIQAADINLKITVLTCADREIKSVNIFIQGSFD